MRPVNKEFIESVQEMRLLLEPAAVRNAAKRKADLTAAWNALEEGREAIRLKDRHRLNSANRTFHREVYAQCGNPLLVMSLDRLQDQVSLISVASWTDWPGYDWADERKEHEMIARAVEAGEVTKAGALTRRHLKRLLAFGRSLPEEAGAS